MVFGWVVVGFECFLSVLECFLSVFAWFVLSVCSILRSVF